MTLKLKDLRTNRDLTQAQVAKLINCSQRTYSHYENRTRERPLGLLIVLADYYKVSLDYIVGRMKRKD